MEQGRNKPIVFIDFDKTICHDMYWRSLPANKQPQLQSLLFGADRRVVFEWMRGLHTAEAVNHLVATALDMPYDEVWDTFVADCRSMHVPQPTLDRVAALRPLVHTVLITANMDSFSRFTVPALKLDTYFDAISNSCDEGRLKTDEGGALFSTTPPDTAHQSRIALSSTMPGTSAPPSPHSAEPPCA